MFTDTAGDVPGEEPCEAVAEAGRESVSALAAGHQG